jgi:ubiquinone/menaquinone biosynthesis C-methylase UbiE
MGPCREFWPTARPVNGTSSPDWLTAGTISGRSTSTPTSGWASWAPWWIPRSGVLDIGTGTGAMLPVFSGAAGLTVALDNSEAMLERADELCRRDCLENIHLCRADVRELPFAGASFDAVNCAMVLQHVEDPQAALHEMGRVLRPGGPLVVTVSALTTSSGCARNWAIAGWASNAMNWRSTSAQQV